MAAGGRRSLTYIGQLQPGKPCRGLGAGCTYDLLGAGCSCDPGSYDPGRYVPLGSVAADRWGGRECCLLCRSLLCRECTVRQASTDADLHVHPNPREPTELDAGWLAARRVGGMDGVWKGTTWARARGRRERAAARASLSCRERATCRHAHSPLSLPPLSHVTPVALASHPRHHGQAHTCASPS